MPCLTCVPPHSTVPSLPLVTSGCSALQSSFLSFQAKLPHLPTPPPLSLSCLPWLNGYLCPHGVVHQLTLLSPDWASVPAFLTSRAQVSSVSTSEPESPPPHTPKSHSCQPSEPIKGTVSWIYFRTQSPYWLPIPNRGMNSS